MVAVECLVIATVDSAFLGSYAREFFVFSGGLAVRTWAKTAMAQGDEWGGMKKTPMTFSAKLVLIAFCLITLGFSLTLFTREQRTAFLLRGTMNDQIDGLSVQGGVALPASARSIRDLLTACGRILTIAPRLKAEPETAAEVRASCSGVSAAILLRSPKNARALAVQLLSAVPAISAEGLARAQRAAPYEPWPLVMRLEATALASSTKRDLVDVAEADFARALRFTWGRDRVAQIYTEAPALRGVIRRAAEALPIRDQYEFVRSLRSAVTKAD